jgi:hypothetical protein
MVLAVVHVLDGELVPVESFLQNHSDVARQREIIRLQYQARVLQTEIEERKKLETALRSALASQRRAEADLPGAGGHSRFLENAVEGLHRVACAPPEERETRELPGAYTRCFTREGATR